MKVADLQQFLNSLSRALEAAEAKKVAQELQAAAAGLEPFRDLAMAQFCDFLAKAEGYARTGVLPTTGKAKAPVQAKLSSVEKIQDASQRVMSLYEKALDPDLQYTAIDEAIKALDKALGKDEALAVAQEFGIAKKLKTKKEALQEIAQKIKGRKESYERTQFRQNYQT